MRTITAHKTEALPLQELTPEEQVFKLQVRNFAKTHVAPLVYQMDADGYLDRDLVSRIHEQGLMKIEIPAEYGGLGHSIFYSILAIEEMAIWAERRRLPSGPTFIPLKRFIPIGPAFHTASPLPTNSFMCSQQT